MKVVVNGVETVPGRAVRRWGDLLALLDEQSAVQGRVVTDVAFDGVREPGFRDAALAARDVAAVRIDVDTARQVDLLLSAVDDALQAVGPLRQSALDVADAFRAYDEARGNQDLASIAAGLASLTVLTNAIASAAGFDLASSGTGGSGVADLSVHVDALIAAQSAGDWIALADLLAHDLAEALDRWTALLMTLRQELLDPRRPA